MNRFMILSTFISGAMLITATALIASDVIFMNEDFPNTSIEFKNTLKSELIKNNYKTDITTGMELSSKLDIIEDSGHILILPDGRYLPADTKKSLLAFLKKGNHLITFSGPSFTDLVINHNGNWLGKDDLTNALAGIQGEKIVDFSDNDISLWERNSGVAPSPITITKEPSGNNNIPDGIHVQIDKLDHWDMLMGATIPIVFPNKSTVTAFWAKGGPDTPELVFEWREKDKSRWMSVVKLSTEWKRYILTPDLFSYWSDNPSKGRGGSDDKFNPANADYCSFGISNGITKQKSGIKHEYWISDIRGIDNIDNKNDFDQPIIETLSPHYKTYESEISSFTDIGTGKKYIADTKIISPIKRSMGLGIDTHHKWRFIPVIQGNGKGSAKKGIAAHLMIMNSGEYTGSVFGYFGFDQKYLEDNSEKILPILMRVIKRIDNGIFLANAGTEHFAYTKGEKIKYGANIVNISKQNHSVKYEVIIADKNNPFRFRNKAETIPANNIKEPVYISKDHNLEISAGDYIIKTRLIEKGKIIDEIAYPIKIIDYKPINEKEIVKVKGSDFYLNDKKWYPLGINYWPSTANGCEDGEDSLLFLSPERYDPELIEQELEIMEKLKMNAISIAYYNEKQGRPLMDFLDRAKNHNIKVHIYTPGLHPLHHDLELAGKMIRSAHLPESTAFFSYDLGWEVHTGYYDSRKEFDKDWHQWVIDRYGSIENAIADWKFTPEIVNGVITGPKDNQLSDDGEWRIFTAAYRRFKDDLISKGYQQTRDFIKTIDKHHLMGSRSGWAGLGAMWAVPAFPFDIFSGAKHLDYMSPEGYAVYGDRTRFLEGGFDNAYCTYASAGKPICWVEYGAGAVGIDPLVYKDYDEATTESQRVYYQNMINMTYETFANGSLGWWYPAGTRLGENSDLGLIKPDGETRPAAFEIAKSITWFNRKSDIPKPNDYININRDKHITGYAGVRAENVQKYVDSFLKGNIPGIKTYGTDTTSINTPMIAVGDVEYNGKNPPKYLNAEFNQIKINDQIIKTNSKITLKNGSNIVIEASIGNTGEAKWISSKNKIDGSVYLVAEINGNKNLSAIKSDTGFLEDASTESGILIENLTENTELKIYMSALNRMDFGEVLRITIEVE